MMYNDSMKSEKYKRPARIGGAKGHSNAAHEQNVHHGDRGLSYHMGSLHLGVLRSHDKPQLKPGQNHRHTAFLEEVWSGRHPTNSLSQPLPEIKPLDNQPESTILPTRQAHGPNTARSFAKSEARWSTPGTREQVPIGFFEKRRRTIGALATGALLTSGIGAGIAYRDAIGDRVDSVAQYFDHTK